MKISKMACNQKDKNSVDVYTDNTMFATLKTEVVLKLNLQVGMELNLEILDAISAEENFAKCYGKAVETVACSYKTKKQLRDYLVKKGFDRQVIGEAIAKLEKLNLINDELYCKKYIEQEKSKKGRYALAWALAGKGIDNATIEKALEGFETDRDTIVLLAEKFMKNRPMDRDNIQKLKMHLSRKGFSFEDINSVVGEMYESGD